MSDLQSLRNIGPKVEEFLILAGITNVNELRKVGALEAVRRTILTGEMKPHIMYYWCLNAALQDRGIFSFDDQEKAEMKMEFRDLLDEIT